MNRLKTVFCAIIGLLWVISVYSEDTLEIKTQEASAPEISAPAMRTAEVTKNETKSIEIKTNGVSAKISGNITLTEGQIVKGISSNGSVGNINHAWIQQPTGLLRLDMNFNDHYQILFEGEGFAQFSYTIPLELWNKDFIEDQKVAYFGFRLNNAQGIYTFGSLNSETYPLQITAGLFEYKYNPDVRNLGEYLFRASAYPIFFLNWFDGPFYRMAGLKASTHFVDWLNFDALLFSELYQEPLQDFSLAGVLNLSNPEIHFGNYTVGKVVSIGAGVDFNRLFSVDDRYTTPSSGAKATDNIYSQDSIGVDASGTTILGNPKYYTFKSTKVVYRASLDIKGFIPPSTWVMTHFFGKEDMKLYFEQAILGLQNYTPHNPGRSATYYDTISQRSPIMAGINLPTYSLLDYGVFPALASYGISKKLRVTDLLYLLPGIASWWLENKFNLNLHPDILNFEIEYLNCPYLPSSLYAFKWGIPKPDVESAQIMDIVHTKWSFYLKKRIGAIALIGQVARDHFQPGNNNVGYTERGDVLPEGNDWWWAFKVQYGY
jgi:hypothetical protein